MEVFIGDHLQLTRFAFRAEVVELSFANVKLKTVDEELETYGILRKIYNYQ